MVDQQDKPDLVREIPLNGRLRTADDDTELVSQISQASVVDYKSLKNIRYTDTHVQGIGGFTKINTNALANVKIKNAFHFAKSFPAAESHVLARALDANSANQKVYRQSTAIPGTGDFTSAAVFTDSTGYGTGQFSTAPGDKVMYCNGKDTAMWGGTEMPVIGFNDEDPNGTYKYDYTKQVTNALTDSDNIATLHRRSDAADASTMLLLHLDNNVTDSSPTTAHTVTNNNVTFSTTYKKFGTHGAVFNGTTSNLTIPDNADFDLSDGTFSIDFWIRVTSGADNRIYYQQTDANNYFKLSLTRSLAYGPFSGGGYAYAPSLSIYAASSEVVSLTGAYFLPDEWHHVAVVENGDSWYIFVDGKVTSTTDTGRAANYSGVVQIGTDGTNYFNGYLDELRVSNNARWAAPFDPPILAYGNAYVTTLYVASQLPAQGFKFYVETANTGTGSATVNYWSSSFAWTSASVTDGTTAGGVSLAQDGSMTFAYTEGQAKARLFDDILAYWYRIEITGCDASTTISQVTVDAPMQPVKELWDGLYRSIGSFQKYASSKYSDYTLNVFNDSWTSSGTGTAADASTMVELDSLDSATGYIVAGFPYRVSGLRLNFVAGKVNAANATATVSYCNGAAATTSASAWTSVGSLDDQTMTAGVSFSKSGVMSWNSPTFASEFKAVINPPMTPFASAGTNSWGAPLPTGNAVKPSATDIRTPLYWYKIQFSANLSGDVQLYYVGGIPAQNTINGYKFTVNHADRLWYWGDETKPNRGKCSSMYAPQVISGNDTIDIELGDASYPVCGRSLFTRYGSTATNVQLICKPTSTWSIVGETLDNFRPYLLSDKIGCIAPLTMDVATVEYMPGLFRRAAIWQGQSGIYMSSGDAPQEISNDIRDKFDPKHANYIGASTLATCTGWIDHVYNEYHWVIPGSTDWVYDIQRKKWSEAPKASKIHCGVAVADASGVPYSYGCTATGFLERLEYGNTFDGTSIAYELQTGDIAPTGRITDRTKLRGVRLIGKAKATTTQIVAVSHYGDSSTTASSPAITAVSMSNTGKRLFNVFRSILNVPLLHIFHALKFTVSTSDETVGFEPIYLALYYKIVGKDMR